MQPASADGYGPVANGRNEGGWRMVRIGEELPLTKNQLDVAPEVRPLFFRLSDSRDTYRPPTATRVVRLMRNRRYCEDCLEGGGVYIRP